MKAEDRPRIEAIVALAESHPDVRLDLARLDADPWLLNVKNGTLDLRTGEMREHRREDYLTKLAPVAYDPQARSPGWDRFLAAVQPDLEVRAFLARFAGYCLTGAMGEQVFAIHHGGGENGKGVYSDTLLAILGLGEYGPWQTWPTFPSGTAFPGATLQETTGLIWARKSGTSAAWEVWPYSTDYSLASPVTVTIPAGNIDWWVHWGRVTIARSTASGTIYVWDGTTSLGAVPAPFSASAWSWAFMAYGWLVITEQSARRVLWYQVNQDGTGLEHVFTQDTWPGAGAQFTPVQVEACGEHDAISGTYTRYVYDARTARWEHGGEIPHVRRAYEENGWWWYATRYRHLIMAETTGVFPSQIDHYHLVQVC